MCASECLNDRYYYYYYLCKEKKKIKKCGNEVADVVEIEIYNTDLHIFYDFCFGVICSGKCQ